MVCLPALTVWASLCLAILIALPAATPSEFKNSAAYALGDVTNCECPITSNRLSKVDSPDESHSERLAGWFCIHSQSSRPSLDDL